VNLQLPWHEWRGSLDGRPTMLIFHLARWGDWRLDLHKFIGADDPECFHTHPATAWRLVLAGGYVEQLASGREVAWRPLRAGKVSPELSHRVVRLLNGRWSYSLWLRGPKTHPVALEGAGWARQRNLFGNPDDQSHLHRN
jgi:hypothetical protein